MFGTSVLRRVGLLSLTHLAALALGAGLCMWRSTPSPQTPADPDSIEELREKGFGDVIHTPPPKISNPDLPKTSRPVMHMEGVTPPKSTTGETGRLVTDSSEGYILPRGFVFGWADGAGLTQAAGVTGDNLSGSCAFDMVAEGDVRMARMLWTAAIGVNDLHLGRGPEVVLGPDGKPASLRLYEDPIPTPDKPRLTRIDLGLMAGPNELAAEAVLGRYGRLLGDPRSKFRTRVGAYVGLKYQLSGRYQTGADVLEAKGGISLIW